MSPSFWSKGARQRRISLKSRYDAQVAALRQKRRECANVREQTEIDAQIKALQSEFQGKVKELRRLLF